MWSLVLLPFVLTALYLSTFLLTLIKNYRVAVKSGLPIVICPIHPNHLVWMMISVPLRSWMERHLPASIFSRLTLSIYGWEYHEKRVPFYKINSESFMLVTCGKNELWTMDQEVISEVMKRPSEFLRSDVGNFVLDVFGPSVATAEGESWARQRKLVTGIINERISRVVFEETWRQSRGMVRDIEETTTSEASGEDRPKSGHVYPATFPSMKRIASNVLFRSAYGMPQDFKQTTKSATGHHKEGRLDMLECIHAVIVNLVPAAVFPTGFLLKFPSFMPGAQWAHRLGAAKDQFPVHVQGRLADERKALSDASDGGEARNNLTSMLIQASEYGANEDGIVKTSKGKPQRMLSEDELRGNLFIFTTAGFETTANVLTFALVALMAQPELQQWLFEEIDALFENEKSEAFNGDNVDYVALYPKAIRCLALMMEVLRVYPPVVHLARGTGKGDTPLVVQTSKKTYYVPPDCLFYGALPSLHSDPKVWRDLNLPTTSNDPKLPTSSSVAETLEDVVEMSQDEYLFRPSRWVNDDTKTMFLPPRGAFAPFSGGPRVCPGQKMAQVEFVCVILALFKDYRIEAVKQAGESDAQLRYRLQRTLKECHAELTIVMDRLEEVQVRFVNRRQE